MNRRSGLGPLDVAVVVAAGVFIVGAFLPFGITEYPVMTITANLLNFNWGVVGVLAALAAVVLAVRQMRITAIVAFVGAGAVVVWRMIDIGRLEGSTFGYGTYVMLAGIVGGIALLVIGLVRSRLDTRRPVEWASPGYPEDVEVPTNDREAWARDPSLVAE